MLSLSKVTGQCVTCHPHVQDPMHLDQANLKRGLWMGQEIGREKSSHTSKSSQVSDCLAKGCS